MCSIENNLFGRLLKLGQQKPRQQAYIEAITQPILCMRTLILSLGYNEFARIQRCRTYTHKLYLYTVSICIKYE